MIDRRLKNAQIFSDTEQRYKTDSTLIQSTKESISSQDFIDERVSVKETMEKGCKKAKIVVSGKRSLEAAELYAKQGEKVCVLNFLKIH